MAEMVRVEEAYIERDDASLFYWHKESRNSNAEVDYIVQFRDKVLPIEVKSGGSGSMASLRILMESKGLSLGIRTSEENFGSLDGGRIRIIPLYMIGEYDRILRCMSFSCLPVEMSGL